MEIAQPSLADEITRKAIEALDRILNDARMGALSWGEAVASLRTLFDTVSGLVDNDTFELISEASRELSGEAVRRTQDIWLVNPEGVLVKLEYAFGESYVWVKTRVPSERTAKWTKVARTSFETAIVPFEAAQERIKQYLHSLSQQGYEVLA